LCIYLSNLNKYSITINFQVLIEAGSASSFELSPRFAANRRDRGSRELIPDVESELQEAMSESIDTDEHGSLLDGK
jgi:hypothetical protein